MKTGPQKIPGASLANFYGDGVLSGSDMEVNCGVVHTTEGRIIPSYADSSGRRGANAPTVTGLPDCKARRLRWHQHYDVDESARALANKLAGVETNTANAFQVELVGTCDPKTRDAWVRAGHRQDVDFIFWPEAPEWALAEVAWLVRWLNANHGIPLTCVKDWLAYGKDSRRPGITPASYGANPARMTFAQWNAFTGWCGHQHVPENDHGDPGNLPMAAILTAAKGGTTPPKEDNVALTADDVNRVAIATVNHLLGGGGALENSDVDRIVKAIGARPVVLTDAQVQAIAANPALAEAIAEKVTAKLATRLAN